jgi:hypothetical protein
MATLICCNEEFFESRARSAQPVEVRKDVRAPRLHRRLMRADRLRRGSRGSSYFDGGSTHRDIVNVVLPPKLSGDSKP